MTAPKKRPQKPKTKREKQKLPDAFLANQERMKAGDIKRKKTKRSSGRKRKS